MVSLAGFLQTLQRHLLCTRQRAADSRGGVGRDSDSNFKSENAPWFFCTKVFRECQGL